MIDEISRNFQIMYYDINNTVEISLNLMTFGYRQFKESFIYQHRDKLTQLCNDFSPTVRPDLSLLSGFVFNKLIDCIRITICFENYFKAKLLSESFIIHKLDKDIFPSLYKEQYTRPIHTSEIIIPGTWRINKNIKGLPTEHTYQIKGILKNTIGIKELMGVNYLNTIQFHNNIVSICKPYFEYRNNLHLYMSESGGLGKQDSEDLKEIINFVNTRIVKEFNEWMTKIGHPNRMMKL